METRDEILRTMAEAYKKDTKKEKEHMLDHVVEVTGYNRALCLAPVVFILEPALPASMRQKRTPCGGCGKPSTLPT